MDDMQQRGERVNDEDTETADAMDGDWNQYPPKLTSERKDRRSDKRSRRNFFYFKKATNSSLVPLEKEGVL